VQLLSPGVAFGCLDLIDVIKRNQLRPCDVHSLSLGVMSATVIYQACIKLDWIEVSTDGCLKLTARGDRAARAGSHQEKFRIMLLDFIEIEQPPWVQLVPKGRRETLLNAPPGICQLIVESGLAYGSDINTVHFWDALAARARGTRDEMLTDIGRRGERLTLQYELIRTGVSPKWVALDSSNDGYDVLSQVSMSDSRLMTIEVKASESGRSNGSFYLTRNEWETAKSSRSHVFHLWSLASSNKLIAVLGVDEIYPHVSEDKGAGLWQKVMIPFRAFFDKFETFTDEC